MNPCSSNPHCSRANRPSSRRDDIRVDILVSYWILEEKLCFLHWSWGWLRASHKQPLSCWGNFLLRLFCWAFFTNPNPNHEWMWNSARCCTGVNRAEVLPLPVSVSVRTAPSGTVFFTLLHSGCQSPAESQTAVCSFSSCGVLDLVSRKCWFNKTVWKEAPYFYFLEVWEG